MRNGSGRIRRRGCDAADQRDEGEGESAEAEGAGLVVTVLDAAGFGAPGPTVKYSICAKVATAATTTMPITAAMLSRRRRLRC